eukprot:gb/GEZN01002420.1/.p1 GENE.gb/GEZN01002420.1/~~gb/GEZN01002420.1/.p1  ORF type:complete len:691 (+),score=61.79 gb/GEZN01002420.1/:91-2073(+)
MSSPAATSAATLFSTTHGRDRRSLRKIEKRDLQAAVKYGKKERGYPHSVTGATRWKYTFANVVYITDETSRVEVTSYVLPLEMPSVPISEPETQLHEQLSELFRKKPSLCTSHTVLVVDQSASMKTCDVDHFKTRSQAVFGTMALDWVGKQLDFGEAKATDVVSLIEFGDAASVVIEREPLTNVLYNKLAQKRLDARPRGHGHFLPALDAARVLLDKDKTNDSCALVLMFLSDGKPSDFMSNPSLANRATLQSELGAKVLALAKNFGNRLLVSTVGFAAQDADFSVLEVMAEQATIGGAHGSFTHAASSQMLSTTVTQLAGSLSATTLKLSRLGPDDAKATLRIPRSVEMVDFAGPSLCDTYTTNLKRWILDEKGDGWVEVPLMRSGCNGVSIGKKPFGMGAERLVYKFREINDRHAPAAGPEMAAKEHLNVQDESLKTDFHLLFCRTQRSARKWAISFNTHIHSILSARKVDPANIPEINFLDCCVYTFADPYYQVSFECGVMVEKLLDQMKYTKWNSNDGFVKGQSHGDNAISLLAAETRQLSIHSTSPALIAGPNTRQSSDFLPPDLSEYPQAFSHFTYVMSKHEVLVCDLQGVLNDSNHPPLFELTDPAIHCRIHDHSHRSHRGRYGRTDRGKKGMHRFFQSHKCNAVCKLLGLPD